jgi:hypothetical protein
VSVRLQPLKEPLSFFLIHLTRSHAQQTGKEGGRRKNHHSLYHAYAVLVFNISFYSYHILSTHIFLSLSLCISLSHTHKHTHTLVRNGRNVPESNYPCCNGFALCACGIRIASAR